MAAWQRISAQLSPEGRRGWDRATTAGGVTLTALMEALGLMLDERSNWLPPEAVERARLIDRERNSRR